MRTPKRILVTGGAGFIGSALIRGLLAREDFTGQVVNLDALTYAGNLQNLAAVAGDPRYRFVRGNISDRELVTQLVREAGIDSIVNLAAESHVDRSIHGPKAFMDANVMGVFTLLEVARAQGDIHFHQVSTDEVFGSLGKTGRFTESSPYDPRSPYSASKAAADHLVRAYANTYGLSITISNCCNNYGPCQFPEKLIPLLLLNCLEEKPIPIYGDGRQVRDWLHVEDHADAIWEVVCRGRGGESYNIGAECEAANIDLVHQLLDIVADLATRDRAALGQLITYVTDRPGHDRRYAIDPTKTTDELGWRPRYDLAAGLVQTVAWYLDNGQWLENVKTGAYRDWLETNYSER